MNLTERAAPPGGPPGAGAPPGRRTPEIQGDPFHALLDLHQARTAPAEGTRRGRDSAPEDQASGSASEQDARGAELPSEAAEPRDVDSSNEGSDPGRGSGPRAEHEAAAAVPAVPAGPATPAEPGAGEPVPAAGGPIVSATPAQPTAPAPGAPEATVLPRPDIGGSSQDSALANEPVHPTPARGLAENVGPAVATGQTTTATTPSLPTAGATTTGDAPSGAQPATAEAPADPAQPETGPGAESHGRPGNETAPRTTPATPAQPNAGGGQPAVPAAPAEPANGQATRAHGEPVRHARLDQAAESVEATIRIAAQRGAGHARIALRPAELGGIEIRLRQTAAGLTATVMADAPEAAQILQQAAGELRRSLEDQGLQLLRFEVGVADDRQSGPGAGAAGEERPRERAGRDGGSADALTDDGPDTGDEVPIQLPNGVLVDVLA